MYDEVFVERLRTVAERNRMTPSMIAIRTGLNERSIRNYIAGKSQPGGYALKMLAKGLGVSVDWLLGIKEEEKP